MTNRLVVALLAASLAACAAEDPDSTEQPDDQTADSPPGGVPIDLTLERDQSRSVDVACDEFFSCDMTFFFDVEVGTQLRDAGLDPRFRVVRADIYTIAADGTEQLVKSFGVSPSAELWTHHSDNRDQKYRVDLTIAETAVQFVEWAKVSGKLTWE